MTMLAQLAKIIDAGGPLRVKYCTNTALWVILNGQLVIETYNDHDKAEDECVRMNNEITARNVVVAMREPNFAMIEAARSTSHLGQPICYQHMIDVVLNA